jgi:hypothetical protein
MVATQPERLRSRTVSTASSKVSPAMYRLEILRTMGRGMMGTDSAMALSMTPMFYPTLWPMFLCIFTRFYSKQEPSGFMV